MADGMGFPPLPPNTILPVFPNLHNTEHFKLRTTCIQTAHCMYTDCELPLFQNTSVHTTLTRAKSPELCTQNMRTKTTKNYCTYKYSLSRKGTDTVSTLDMEKDWIFTMQWALTSKKIYEFLVTHTVILYQEQKAYCKFSQRTLKSSFWTVFFCQHLITVFIDWMCIALSM